MGKPHLSKWWGLYALVPLMMALIVIDADGAMSQTWHLVSRRDCLHRLRTGARLG